MEIVPEAIRDAIANARDNNIRNAEFLTGDAAKLMPQLYRKGLRPDVIVTDPPRAGCAPEVLKTFAAMRPKRIVYVSCNPASLARDIGILDELGYKALEIQPVDMFPQTGHVESVCLLVKNNHLSIHLSSMNKKIHYHTRKEGIYHEKYFNNLRKSSQKRKFTIIMRKFSQRSCRSGTLRKFNTTCR